MHCNVQYLSFLFHFSNSYDRQICKCVHLLDTCQGNLFQKSSKSMVLLPGDIILVFKLQKRQPHIVEQFNRWSLLKMEAVLATLSWHLNSLSMGYRLSNTQASFTNYTWIFLQICPNIISKNHERWLSSSSVAAPLSPYVTFKLRQF